MNLNVNSPVLNKQFRKNFIFGIIGDNGTGKSVTTREIVKRWKDKRPNGIVAGFDPSGVIEDYIDIPVTPDNWLDKALKLRNALLVLDETRLLHPSPQTDKRLSELLQRRRHWNVDIIYIVHNPGVILESLTYFTTHYYIFYTQSRKDKFKAKVPNYLMLQNASVLINKYVKMEGRGEYPYFPHLIIDTEQNKIKAVNISSDKLTKAIRIQQH